MDLERLPQSPARSLATVAHTLHIAVHFLARAAKIPVSADENPSGPAPLHGRAARILVRAARILVRAARILSGNARVHEGAARIVETANRIFVAITQIPESPDRVSLGVTRLIESPARVSVGAAENLEVAAQILVRDARVFMSPVPIVGGAVAMFGCVAGISETAVQFLGSAFQTCEGASAFRASASGNVTPWSRPLPKRSGFGGAHQLDAVVPSRLHEAAEQDPLLAQEERILGDERGQRHEL